MAVNRIQELIGLMQKNLECSICLELMTSPVATKCEHYFCRFCITEFLEKKRSVPCPLCKQPVTKRSLKEKGELNNIVHAINHMITAFEQDSGVIYSPPGGPQTFFPCTPDTINNKPDSHQTKPRKNVRQSTRTSKPGKGTSEDARQSHITNSSEDVFAVPSTSGVSLSGRRKSPVATSSERDTSRTTGRPSSRSRQVHPASDANDQPRSRLRQDIPVSDTDDQVRSNTRQDHPASDQPRSKLRQDVPVSDTDDQVRSRQEHPACDASTSGQSRLRLKHVHAVSDSNDQVRSRTGHVLPALDNSDQPKSRSRQTHPASDANNPVRSKSRHDHAVSNASDQSRRRSRSVHSVSDTNNLLRCLDENSCGMQKETQDAAYLPQTSDDSCAQQTDNRVGSSPGETSTLQQNNSCLVTSETEVDSSKKTELPKNTVQINNEVTIHNEKVLITETAELDQHNVNLVKPTNRLSEDGHKIDQRESNERSRRLKRVSIESERSKQAYLDRCVRPTENRASDKNCQTNQQKTTLTCEPCSTNNNDDNASSSQFLRPLPPVTKTYSRRSATTNSTNWNACLPSCRRTSTHKQSDSATDSDKAVRTQGNNKNSNNQKDDSTLLSIPMPEEQKEQRVSKNVFEQDSDRPDFTASESYEEFMLTPPVRKKHIFKRKGNKTSVDNDHCDSPPLPVEELSPPADPYLFVVGHTPVAKSKKRGRPRSRDKKGKPPTMASLVPRCRGKKSVSFSDVTHCEEIHDTSSVVVRRTGHQTETDTSGSAHSLDQTPALSCLSSESMTVDDAVTDLTDESFARLGTTSSSIPNSKADSKKGTGRGKSDQGHPQKRRSKPSKEETAEAERLREKQTEQLASWIGQAEDHDFLFSTQEAQASIESVHTSEQDRAIALADGDDDDSNDGFCLMGPVLDDKPVRVESSQQKANFDRIVAAQSCSFSDQSVVPDKASHVVEAEVHDPCGGKNDVLNNQKMASLSTRNKHLTTQATNTKGSACGLSVSPDVSQTRRQVDTIAETPLSHLQSPGSSIVLPTPQAGTALPKFSTPIIQSARRTRLSKQHVPSDDGAPQKPATLTDVNPSPEPGKHHKCEDPEISVIASNLNSESLVQAKHKTPANVLTRSISIQKNEENATDIKPSSISTHQHQENRTKSISIQKNEENATDIKSSSISNQQHQENRADNKSPSISNQQNQENIPDTKSPPNKKRSSDRLRRQKKDSNISSPLITAIPSTFTEESSDVIVSSVVSKCQPDKQVLLFREKTHHHSDLETDADRAEERVKPSLQHESDPDKAAEGEHQTCTTEHGPGSQNNGEEEGDAECCSSSTEDLDITPGDNEFEQPDMALQSEEIQQKYSGGAGGQLTHHSAPSIDCVSETQRFSADNSSSRPSASLSDTDTRLPSFNRKKTQTSVKNSQDPASNRETLLQSSREKSSTFLKNSQDPAPVTETQLQPFRRKKTRTFVTTGQDLVSNTEEFVTSERENRGVPMATLNQETSLREDQSNDQSPSNKQLTLNSTLTHVPESLSAVTHVPDSNVSTKAALTDPATQEWDGDEEQKSGPESSETKSSSTVEAKSPQSLSSSLAQSPNPVGPQQSRVSVLPASDDQTSSCTPSQSVLMPLPVKTQPDQSEATTQPTELTSAKAGQHLNSTIVKQQSCVENAEHTIEQSEGVGSPSQSVVQPVSVKLHSCVENTELTVQQSDLSVSTPSQSLLQPVAYSNAPDTIASSLMAPEYEKEPDCSDTDDKEVASSSLEAKSLSAVQETQEPGNTEGPKHPSLSQHVILESPPESSQLNQKLNICDVQNTVEDGAILNRTRMDSDHPLDAIAKSPEQAKNNQPSPIDSINQNSESLMSQSSPVSPEESENKKNIVPASPLKSDENRKKAIPSSSSPQREEGKKSVIPSTFLSPSGQSKKKEVVSLVSPHDRKRKLAKEVARDENVDSSGERNLTPDLFPPVSPACKVVSSAPPCTTSLSPDTDDADSVLVVRRTKRKCFSLGASPFKETTPLSVKRRKHRGKQTSLSEKFDLELPQDVGQEEGKKLSGGKCETSSDRDKNQESLTKMNRELQEKSTANKEDQSVSPGNYHSVSGSQRQKDGCNIDDTESPAKTGQCEKSTSDINMKSDSASKPSPSFPRKKTVRGLARGKPRVSDCLAKNVDQQILASTNVSGEKLNRGQISDVKASEMVVPIVTPVQNHKTTASSDQYNHGQVTMKASEMHCSSVGDVEDCVNTISETPDLGCGVSISGVLQSSSRHSEEKVLPRTHQPETLVPLTEDDDLMEVDDDGTSADSGKRNLQSKHSNQMQTPCSDLKFDGARKTNQDSAVSDVVPPGSFDKPIIITQSSNKSENHNPHPLFQSSTSLDDATIPPPSFDLKFDEDEEDDDNPQDEIDNSEIENCRNDAEMEKKTTTTNNFKNNGQNTVVEINTISDKRSIASKAGMAGDARSPKSSHGSRNLTPSSEEEVVAVKKRKSAVIDSDTDAGSDQDHDQDSEASFQLNFTSSSALSSQSEVINTQERSKMESELDRLRREIAEMEARLQGQPSSRSDSAGDVHELATPGHHDNNVAAHRVSSHDSSDDEEMPDIRSKRRGKTKSSSGIKKGGVKKRRRHRYISSEEEEKEENENQPRRQRCISSEEEEKDDEEKDDVKQPRRHKSISSDKEEEEEVNEDKDDVKQPRRHRYISSDEDKKEEEKKEEKRPRRHRYVSSDEEEKEKRPRQQLMDSYLKDVYREDNPDSVKSSSPVKSPIPAGPVRTTNQTPDRDSDQDSSDLFLSPLSPSPPPPLRQTLARKEPFTRPRSLFNLESPSVSVSRSASKFRQSLDFTDTVTSKAHSQHIEDNQNDLENSQESNSGLSGSLKNIPESQFSASGGADNAETSPAENHLRCICENAATPRESVTTLNRTNSEESGDSPLPSPLKARMTTEGENKENIEDCDDDDDGDDDLPRWKNKRFGFISSGLDQEKASMLRKLAESNECKVYSKFNDHVTHVIIKTERERRVCERTLKYFQGIAAGCWVLSFDWVLDSVREKRFVSEKHYEIVGDSVKGDDHRGPERSRLSTSPFLQGFAFTSVGVSPDMSKKELSQLLTLCGGEVVEDPWALAAHPARHRLVLRCVDSEAQPPTPAEIELFNGQYKHFSLVTVAREWILDSICTHTLQPLEDYVFNTCPNLHLPF